MINGQKITIKDAEGKKVKGTVTEVLAEGRFVLTTKEGFEMDCNPSNSTILSNAVYFDSYTENHVEVNRINGKYRILDENNDFRPFTRFQEVKECYEEGILYVVLNGEKEVVHTTISGEMEEVSDPRTK